MEHLRLDPRFRRQPKPKRAGWVGRETYLFLLQVSADYDLRGRFSPSRMDLDWLTEEWMTSRDDESSLGTFLRVTAKELLLAGLQACREAGLVTQDGEDLVIADWEDFYKPSKTGAQRTADYERRKREREATDGTDAGRQSPSGLTELTPLTEAVRTDATYARTNVTPRTPPTPPTTTDPPAAAENRQGVARVVEAPTTPPGEWQGQDFWRWAQWKRWEAAKLPPEAPPRPEKLSRWWSEVRALFEADALQEAFLNFGDEKHWQRTSPPLPFAGFMSQWNRFVPPGGAHASG